MALTKAPEELLARDLTSALSITTADNTAQMALVSTDADASDGPILEMFRNSSSPADDDDLGIIKFFGENDASEKIEYGIIEVKAVDVSDGTEDGSINITAMLNGTARSRLFSNSTETVFNEGSRDLDFRVESDSNTHALFVQASDGSVGIGVSNPARELEVTGTGNVYIRVTAPTANDSAAIELKNTAETWTIAADDTNSDALEFRTSGATPLTLTTSGKLLHGTTTVPTGVLLGNQLVSSSATGAEIIAFRADTSVSVGDKTGAFLLGNSDTDGTEDHFVGMYGKASSTNGSQNVHFVAGRAGYEGDTPDLTLFSGGDLSLGTTSPAAESKLHVETATSNPNSGSPTDSSALMVNGGTTTEGTGPVIALRNISGSKETIARFCAETTSNNNGDLTISVYGGGATVDEKVRIQSGGGISFNGDTATANALDDYEEGTHATAFSASTSGTVTHGYNTMAYTKVGRLVTCTGYFTISSVSSPVGYLAFSLPFTIPNGNEYSASASISFNSLSSGAINEAWAICVNNTNLCRVYIGASTSVSASFAQLVQAGTDVRVTISFMVS